jgi:hypothetical protein
MNRVKCISVHAYPGAPADPELELSRFYTVQDPSVHTIADETAYIRVLVNHYAIERPRHLFGPILSS